LYRPVGNLAANANLVGRVKRSVVEEKDPFLANSSELAVMARKEEHLAGIGRDSTWVPLEPDQKSRVWSDDYVNILAAMRIFK